ncbi:shikimate kinase [Mammaliicoccus sciuri]|uniref:shikimate kinase n=1 Tax=Mammaliicoccus sciuri TaxID=1296 RepID=UPI0034DD3261
MKKIVILGSSGSGKSYLSKKLSKELNIEVYHLDNLIENLTGVHLAIMKSTVSKN